MQPSSISSKISMFIFTSSVISTLNIQPLLLLSTTRYYSPSSITFSFFTSIAGYNVITTSGSNKKEQKETAFSTWIYAQTFAFICNSGTSNSTTFPTSLCPSASSTSASAICCLSTVCFNHRSPTNPSTYTWPTPARVLAAKTDCTDSTVYVIW